MTDVNSQATESTRSAIPWASSIFEETDKSDGWKCFLRSTTFIHEPT